MGSILNPEIIVKIHRKNTAPPRDIFKADPRFLPAKSDVLGKELQGIIDNVLNKKNDDNLVKI